ncbi:MAG: carbamoyltransferase C-terminal domain-containing protein [Planctomycetia bacterium]
MTVILGINFLHADSSACLFVDGQLTMAVAEERLGRRVKHDPAFPAAAIRAVLDDAGLALKDIDNVAVPRRPRANLGPKVRYVAAHPLSGFRAYLGHRRRRRMQDEALKTQVARACGSDPGTARFETTLVEHHLAHVASAYYCSPFEGLTAGFSFDGSGDFASMMATRCEGQRIEVLDRVLLPHSLGFFYTAICQAIGFDRFGEEYKVMGLAAYGEDEFGDLMKRLVQLPGNGWFRLARGLFVMPGTSGAMECDDAGKVEIPPLYSESLLKAIGGKRHRDDPVSHREKALARSCQVRFEEAFMHCAKRLHQLVPTDKIAYAGGCALNGVANARLLRDTPFRQPYLQAASSDEGCAIGAALWTWHNVLGRKERFHMKHAYWGPRHPETAMRKSAEAAGTPWRTLEADRVVPVVAQLIRQGLVVGWYQGRSEWGPRALGNRSILADPTRPEMKDLINAKIKRREMFRPFAPTVLRPSVSKYFEQDVFSPFMMHVVKIRPEWREKMPAITHVDGTGRLQSIERETNPLYYDLIQEFGRLSGVDILLNTSFNENEPIVDTPDQALACFLRTGLDALCLGHELLVKPEFVDVLARVVA